MNTRALTIALASAFAASLSACADLKMTPAGPVPDVKFAVPTTAAAPTDAMIVAAVRAELGKHESIKTSDLKIAAKNGEVTLSGTVASGQQLAQIATIVQKVSGVKAVIPDVEVNS